MESRIVAARDHLDGERMRVSAAQSCLYLELMLPGYI